MTKNKTEHISYTIHGDGKPVLLIHGWSMHSGVWNHFVEEFASMYKVITVDLRGHGKSAAMDGPYSFDTFPRTLSN
jgi:pimeloyl-[acyl-carrier protein] methyl ester esterase